MSGAFPDSDAGFVGSVSYVTDNASVMSAVDSGTTIHGMIVTSTTRL
jgi:hypothetical protein